MIYLGLSSCIMNHAVLQALINILNCSPFFVLAAGRWDAADQTVPYQLCLCCLWTNGVTACMFIPFDPYTIGKRCNNQDLLSLFFFFCSFFLVSVVLTLMGIDDRRWTAWASFLNAKHFAALKEVWKSCCTWQGDACLPPSWTEHFLVEVLIVSMFSHASTI